MLSLLSLLSLSLLSVGLNYLFGSGFCVGFVVFVFLVFCIWAKWFIFKFD